MILLSRFAFAVVLAVSLGACGQRPAAPESSDVHAAAAKNQQIGKTAPAFTLKDSDGRSVSLADYRGKVVLLNFWATWCGPCKIEIPWFGEFEQKYKDRGFAVIGVSMDDEGWEVVKPYLTKNRVNYRVLVGDDAVARDYGGVESLPTTFLIDKAGRIASVHIGLVGKNDYEHEIVQLLDGRNAPGPAGSGARAD